MVMTIIPAWMAWITSSCSTRFWPTGTEGSALPDTPLVRETPEALVTQVAEIDQGRQLPWRIGKGWHCSEPSQLTHETKIVLSRSGKGSHITRPSSYRRLTESSGHDGERDHSASETPF